MVRFARDFVAPDDRSDGFPVSREALQWQLDRCSIDNAGPMQAADLADLAMGGIDEIRVATIDAGQALVMLGRFESDDCATEEVRRLVGDDVSGPEFLVALLVDRSGNIEGEESPRVRRVLTGLRGPAA